MAQFNIRNIREISNDPLTKFTNSLAKKFSKFINEQQQGKLENKEDIYSDAQDIDTVIRLHSFVNTKYFDGITQFYPPNEPDDHYCQLWIRGYNMGNTMRDYSHTGKDIELIGDPLLIDGTPLDLGVHTSGPKSTALRFNRPTSGAENTEYIKVAHDSNNQVSGLTAGISYFIRFRIFDLSSQGGFARTLFKKIDDNTPSNGAIIKVESDGSVTFTLTRAGTEYRKVTGAGSIVTNTIYDLWCTYANSGNTIHIYINNVDKSLSDPGAQSYPGGTNHDIALMKRTEGGFVYGDLYDFRIYRERVITAAEVGYMYTNKWTIANIPFGQVMVTNYWATYGTGQFGFTTTGFTTTGFTAG